MTKADKNCPHCGSSSIMPISYGLKTDEAIEENAKERNWVWGGCVMRVDTNGGLKTHYCSDCKESYCFHLESQTLEKESVFLLRICLITAERFSLKSILSFDCINSSTFLI